VTIRDHPFDARGYQGYSYSLTGEKAVTGPEGVAIFEGFEGAYYRIDGILSRTYTDILISKPADVLPGKGAAVVELILNPWRPGRVR